MSDFKGTRGGFSDRGKAAANSRESHRYSDVDQTPQSQHHTLGPKASQAAPGNHEHAGLKAWNIGDLKYSLCEENTWENCWLPADGSAIPAAYPDAIALFGANLPNLTDRSPRTTNTAGDVGTTGGSDSVTLVTGNLPSHNHTVGTLAANGEAAHTHGAGSYSAGTSGGHTHPVPRKANVGSSSGYVRGNATNEPNDTTNSDGAHTHNVNGTSDPGSSHTHTITGSTANTGSGTAVTITPRHVKTWTLIYVGDPVA